MQLINSGIRQVIRVILKGVIIVAAWPMPAYASVLDIRGVDSIYLINWNGSGGLTGEDDYCVISRSGGTPLPYDVAAWADGFHDGEDFVLRNASSEELKVSLSWRGNATGGSFVPLQPYETSGDLTGQQRGARNCRQSDANATIRIDISAATLASASAGTYSGTFRIDALQYGGDNLYIYQSFSVTLPELVQITDLDNIDLGGFDGVNDLIEGDEICIFRNGFGNFRIKASGGPSDVDAFLLSNGAGQIPYQVAFKGDGMASFVSLAEGEWLAGSNGHGSQDCGGGTNASVQVTALAADMATATPGTYTGTLYLTVEPD